MKKRILYMVAILIILLFLTSVTTISYASQNEEQNNTENSYIYFDVKTREESEISIQDSETELMTSKELHKNLLANDYTTKGFLPSAMTYSIIDGDDRTNIGVDPRICEIISQFPDGNIIRGTGFTVYKDMLLTAGHCVYRPENGGWATVTVVSPGATGWPGESSYKRPYGAFTNPKGMILDANFCNRDGLTAKEIQERDFALVTFNQDLGVRLVIYCVLGRLVPVRREKHSTARV